LKLNCLGIILLLLSCATSKREEIPFWEENSYGEFEIDYFIDTISGKAKGFAYFTNGSFYLKVLGPLNINLFSVNIKEGEVEIIYKDEIYKEKLCLNIDVQSLISYFNGDTKPFPPFFSCYGWDISYDGEGGMIRGIKGDDVFFIYNTTEKPFLKFSFEYLNKGISINGRLKKIWRMP